MDIQELQKLQLTVDNNKPGIYAIFIKTTEKIYIGQSRKIRARIWEHLSSLRRQKHRNIYIQRSFDKYGSEDFLFLGLENCAPEELNSRESHWASLVLPEKLLNLGAIGEYLPLSKESIEKIRLKNTGRPKSQETKDKISKTKKGVKNPNYHCEWTDERRQKMSEQWKGKKTWITGKTHTQESKEKMSSSRRKDFSPMTGKHHSEETKDKIRQSLLGRKQPPRPLLLTITQVKEIKQRLLNETAVKLAKEFNVSRGTISNIKRKKSWADVE